MSNSNSFTEIKQKIAENKKSLKTYSNFSYHIEKYEHYDTESNDVRSEDVQSQDHSLVEGRQVNFNFRDTDSISNTPLIDDPCVNFNFRGTDSISNTPSTCTSITLHDKYGNNNLKTSSIQGTIQEDDSETSVIHSPLFQENQEDFIYSVNDLSSSDESQETTVSDLEVSRVSFAFDDGPEDNIPEDQSEPNLIKRLQQSLYLFSPTRALSTDGDSQKDNSLKNDRSKQKNVKAAFNEDTDKVMRAKKILVRKERLFFAHMEYYSYMVCIVGCSGCLMAGIALTVSFRDESECFKESTVISLACGALVLLQGFIVCMALHFYAIEVHKQQRNQQRNGKALQGNVDPMISGVKSFVHQGGADQPFSRRESKGFRLPQLNFLSGQSEQQQNDDFSHCVSQSTFGPHRTLDSTDSKSERSARSSVTRHDALEKSDLSEVLENVEPEQRSDDAQFESIFMRKKTQTIDSDVDLLTYAGKTRSKEQPIQKMKSRKHVYRLLCFSSILVTLTCVGSVKNLINRIEQKDTDCAKKYHTFGTDTFAERDSWTAPNFVTITDILTCAMSLLAMNWAIIMVIKVQILKWQIKDGEKKKPRGSMLKFGKQKLERNAGGDVGIRPEATTKETDTKLQLPPEVREKNLEAMNISFPIVAKDDLTTPKWGVSVVVQDDNSDMNELNKSFEKIRCTFLEDGINEKGRNYSSMWDIRKNNSDPRSGRISDIWDVDNNSLDDPRNSKESSSTNSFDHNPLIPHNYDLVRKEIRIHYDSSDESILRTLQESVIDEQIDLEVTADEVIPVKSKNWKCESTWAPEWACTPRGGPTGKFEEDEQYVPSNPGTVYQYESPSDNDLSEVDSRASDEGFMIQAVRKPHSMARMLSQE